jgi:hypothetical protein
MLQKRVKICHLFSLATDPPRLIEIVAMRTNISVS